MWSISKCYTTHRPCESLYSELRVEGLIELLTRLASDGFRFIKPVGRVQSTGHVKLSDEILP